MWWAHYKKTFLLIQLLIALMAFQIHRQVQQTWAVTAVFFLMMQLGALLGAVWAGRLRRRLVASFGEVNK
jgi:low temperature requirement protein LtrA